MTDNKNLGNRGELIAKEYFLNHGYSFIYQNYKSGHFEIDLIFALATKIIFVEVKTRIKTTDSTLENPLTRLQITNLKHAINDYCFKNHLDSENARLDLVIILADKATHRASLKHYRDIF